MVLEQNKTIVLEFYKAINQENFEQAKQMLAPNMVAQLMSGAVIRGGNNFVEHLRMARSTFPDVYYTIEDVLAEDDKVVSYGTFMGTQHGEILGIAPMGHQVKFSIVQIDQLADGKIVEHRTIGDSLTMVQQLRGENLVWLSDANSSSVSE
ncbi:MAG: ester cyclase [Lyngbya sp. HA4199-MV5]|jgi:predicted ester cyclase|nr:ester cyclase [Lyngbya sp. HA4199-MV5]